jgi:hypothetical protein
MNLVERDIHYTHRLSDFTQDVYVDGYWVASATNNHTGEEIADEVQCRRFLAEQGLVDDVPAACAAEGVTSTQIPSWLADAQAKAATCSEAHPCDNINHNHTGYRMLRCGLPNPLARIQAALDDTPAPGIENEPSEPPTYPDQNGRAPSLYARLVAECQAELDARMAKTVVMVVDVDFAPFGFAA